MASPHMKEHPSDVVLSTISKGASPESKCPICLDHFKNISYIDVCLHKFCFCCIHEWSKNKAQCPLCKQPFNSIYHTIKSEDNYKRFDLRPTENGSFGNVAGQRFRYRTTVTGERRPAARRTSPPPDHGVLFEGLRGSIPQRHHSDLHSMIRRMTAQRRRQREGLSVPSLPDQDVVKFRRDLYRRGVRVNSVLDGGRSRETSAEFFKRNPACLHRLVPWLRRELTVLYGAHGSLVNIVQHIIMTLVTRYNLDDQAVEHELRPFLLSHTEHFLYEFRNFARSPFNMEAYDQRAVYDLPHPTGESSSSENSVIAISEDEIESIVQGAQDYATPQVNLSQTTWDDETPGPSYSLESSQVCPVPVRDSDSDSSEGEAIASVSSLPCQNFPASLTASALEEDSDEDCVFIGFVKPVAERTPELVQLSSDSEHMASPQTPQAPQHIRFLSDSDRSPWVTPTPTESPSMNLSSPEETARQVLSSSKEGSLYRKKTHYSSHSSKEPLSDKSVRKQREGNGSSPNSRCSYDHGRRNYTETCRRWQDDSQSHSGRRSKDLKDKSQCNRSQSSSHSQTKSHSRIFSSSRLNRSNSRTKSSSRRNRSPSARCSRIYFSSRRNQSHSRSNSRTKSSSRRNRSPSASCSRIYFSSWRNRSHSRSNSRTKSSSRRNRSPSASCSRIYFSSRRNRSHSRSNSRTKSSRRRNRSPSASCSRIYFSSRRNRSHSRSNSRTKSSSRQNRSPSASCSRIYFSSRRNRSHSRSNSRTKSSSRRNRSPSESHSRISSSSRQNQSQSRSCSRTKSSTYQNRSPSENRSRMFFSSRQNRSHSRSNSSRRKRSISRSTSGKMYSKQQSKRHSTIKSSSYRQGAKDGFRCYYKSIKHSDGRDSRSSSSQRSRRSSKSSSKTQSSPSRQTSCHDQAKKRMFKTKHQDDVSKNRSSTHASKSVEDCVRKKHKKLKKKNTKSPHADNNSEGHKKKKHKKKSKRHRSPVVIMITSDSENPCETPTGRNIDSALTVTKANIATEILPLNSSFSEMEQQSAMEPDNSLVEDTGSSLQTGLPPSTQS